MASNMQLQSYTFLSSSHGPFSSFIWCYIKTKTGNFQVLYRQHLSSCFLLSMFHNQHKYKPLGEEKHLIKISNIPWSNANNPPPFMLRIWQISCYENKLCCSFLSNPINVAMYDFVILWDSTKRLVAWSMCWVDQLLFQKSSAKYL